MDEGRNKERDRAGGMEGCKEDENKRTSTVHVKLKRALKELRMGGWEGRRSMETQLPTVA